MLYFIVDITILLLGVLLHRLAVEELLKDAKRAKERAERVGPIGW